MSIYSSQGAAGLPGSSSHVSEKSHAQRAVETAAKVVEMAEASLRGIDVVISTWPGEFRAVMWDAVAAIATTRAINARQEGKS